ncbi:apolipoprotein N-acyltransferase [Zhouia spongiae]|uniref:Apolipoprotein N-acyltransferase n=1 Tax=Zhouia spongiae TaxID=2202721 RepID=A0ABY3YJ38_9FLAO|nr:apolipoprotein N-acyltransferase [Zhouia spongiae]UNY97603.1 apolipoprotein N-acyltransferase [Zhouia spongiae]
MKKNYLLAAFTGLLLAMAWPTYGLPVLGFIAFVPLLFAEKNIRESDSNKKGLKVFGTAYLSFLIWNSITTWWLWYSSAFGMFFAILVNSLLMALVFLIYHKVANKLPTKIHLVFLPAIWMAFEKFHLNWDFSWPWLNLGNLFSEYTSWIQWYEYTGTFGGSLWIWIVNIGLFKTYEKYIQEKNKKVLSTGVGKNILLIAIPVIISFLILKNYQESKNTVDVILIQPNVDPYTEKYDQKNVQITKGLIAQASEKIDQNTDYVIAPETVLSEWYPIEQFDVSPQRKALQSLCLQNKNLNVIVGAVLYHMYGKGPKPSKYANITRQGDWYDEYNAALQVNNSDSTQFYYKSKLVVGVENFPFKPLLEPLLGNILLDLGGTISTKTIQKDRGVFTSKDRKGKAAPIICYESVYGEFVTGYVENGANFLAIITNDAWWDKTQGHQQHLSYARLRAIETRKSIARSANTGISAFINEKGEIRDTLPYDTKGSLKGTITINDKKTFYVKYGDFIARTAILIAGLIVLFAIARKKS